MRGLDWEREGQDWPHRAASRFVAAGGLRWHVQRWAGPQPDAPLALLIHGTGASTHSWRDLVPCLTGQLTVLAIDLPGHAFTGLPPGGASSPALSLPGMAAGLGELLRALDAPPALIVGHSAGAAVALRMCLDRSVAPRAVVGLNPALLPLRGLAGQFFSPVARLLSTSSLVPRLFAARATQPRVLRSLLDSTGSTLDAQGLALYGRLVGNASHAAGALGMMANWDLETLARSLPRLATPLDLVVGLEDRTVPPAQASRVLALLPPALGATCARLEGLGHLAHEEQPQRVAGLILQAFHARAPAAPAAAAG